MRRNWGGRPIVEHGRLDCRPSIGGKLKRLRIERRITWYENPDAAEADVREHYRRMTPQERLDEMVGLLNRVGKWNERRLTRVARLIELGER